MLQSIRKHTQGWIAAVIIGLLSLSFLMWGVEYYISNASHSGKKTVVNGVAVTEASVNQLYKQLKAEAEKNHPNQTFTDEQLKALNALALKRRIEAVALEQEALAMGFVVPNALIASFIQHMPPFQSDGHFSSARYQQVLMANGLTTEQFEAQVREVLLSSEMENALQSTEFVTPLAINNYYASLMETRDISYAVILASQFLSSIKISPEAIERYYQAHQEAFSVPQKVKVAYVRLSSSGLRQTVSIPDRDVYRYYQDHVEVFTSPLQWQVNEVTIPLPSDPTAKELKTAQQQMDHSVQQLKAGKLFETLKGQTTWLVQGKIPSDYSDRLTAMRVGQVSTPFQTSTGLHMFQLLGIKEGKVRPYGDVQTEIRQRLIEEKVNNDFSSRTDQLADLAYTHPDTLQPIAQALQLSIQTSGWITRDTFDRSLDTPAVLAAVFSESVLNQGNNSEPIELQDGSLIVLRVVAHEDQTTTPLVQVREGIINRLQQQQAMQLAQQTAEKIQQELASGLPAFAVATKYGVTWQAKKAVSRENKDIPLAVREAAFNTAPASDLKHPAIALAPMETGVGLVEITNVTPGRYSDATLNQRLVLKQQLESFQGRLAYQLYVQGVLGHSRIQ